MAEHSRFFDSIDPLDPDKVYTAEDFVKYLGGVVTGGIVKGEGNNLKVETSGSNMNVTVDTGMAYLVDRQYENDSKLSLTHEIEALGKSRIDRVVLRLVLDMDARYIKAFVKKGVAGVAPVAPPLTRTGDVYEISLAQVKVIGGQTYINVADVADERGNPDVCPWAGSKILPNFDDAALENLVNEVNNMYVAKEYTGDLNDLVESGFYYHTVTVSNTPFGGAGQVQVIAAPDGFIEQVWSSTNNVLTGRLSFSRVGKLNGGVAQWNKMTGDGQSNGWKYINVPLSDSIVNASPTTAASSNAIKQVNDKFEEKIKSGAGVPEGVVTAQRGSIYLRLDGTPTTTLYVKTSGGGNTGWTAK